MSRRKRFAKAMRFAIYYGSDMEKPLSKYDVSIVESLGHTEAGIMQIKESGALAIAYISVIEINPKSPMFRHLSDEDFLYSKGEKIKNEIYGNFLVDLHSERWKKILFHHISYLLLSLGYDGIFLDTISCAESPDILQEFGVSIINEAVSLVSKIRKEFEEYIIIQNNGMEKLLSYTSGIVDGVCWENPPFGNRKSMLWMNEIIKRLDDSRIKDKTKVLVVYESSNEDNQNILTVMESRGYMTYLAPPDYLHLWTEMQK